MSGHGVLTLLPGQGVTGCLKCANARRPVTIRAKDDDGEELPRPQAHMFCEEQQSKYIGIDFLTDY